MDPPTPFPLMKLPAELRLIIFEHALSCDQDLYWRWKSAGPRKRVGYFSTEPPLELAGYPPPATHEKTSHNIITRLHISRQIRVETLHLWEKFAILHFDGTDKVQDSLLDQLAAIQNNDLDRAVIACRFFANHTRTRSMPQIPRIVIDAAYSLECKMYFEKLLGLLGHDQHGYDPRISDIRVVVHKRHIAADIILDEMLMDYKSYFRTMVQVLDFSFVESHRRVKIFPEPGFEKLAEGILEKFMSAEEFETTMDLVRNGY